MFQQPAGLDGPRNQSYGSPRSRGGPRGMGAQMSYNPYNAAAGPFGAPQQAGQMGQMGGGQFASPQMGGGQMGGGQFAGRFSGGAPPMPQQRPPRQINETQQFQPQPPLGPRGGSNPPDNVGQGQRSAEGGAKQEGANPVAWVRSALARDPFVEPNRCQNWATFWLMTVVQTMGVSPESGIEVVGMPDFRALGAVLRAGAPNSGFYLVRRLLQSMYHNTAHMSRLFEADKKHSGYVLVALQNGILSEDRDTAVMIFSALRNMAHRAKTEWLQNFFWNWFEEPEQGGLVSLAQCLERHRDESTRKAAVEMIGYLCPTQAHASRLFSHLLHSAFPDTASYLLMAHDMLQHFQFQHQQQKVKGAGNAATRAVTNGNIGAASSRSNMITLGTVRHIVKFAFRWAQSRQGTPLEGRGAKKKGKGRAPNDERSRCAALSLLAELWLLMDVSVTDGDERKRSEVMKAILGLLKRAARETSSISVKITANACLFVLLEAFVRKQRPYAPYVYKTLIFSLIESKSDSQALREFMMASMKQSMGTLRQIPVGILIDPIVKQASLMGYDEDDLALLAITAQHPRLGIKHALIVLDLLGKIVLHDPVYCRMCWEPFFTLLRRFPRQLQMQNFVLSFCQVALKQLLQNEVRASAAEGLDGLNSSAYSNNGGVAGRSAFGQSAFGQNAFGAPQASLSFGERGQQKQFSDGSRSEPLDPESEHLLRRLFYEVDLNNSNSIEKRELLQYLQRASTPLHSATKRFPRLEPLLKPKTYASTLERMNTASNGRISFEEFRDFAVRLSTRQGASQSGSAPASGGEFDFGSAQVSPDPLADFTNEKEAEMAAVQGRRVMILAVLGRLVNLRNPNLNSQVVPILRAAKRNLMELFLSLPNLVAGASDEHMKAIQGKMKMRDDMCKALDQMIRICDATTPPTDLPSEKVGNISVDDRIWQKANIDDLDKSVANVKRGVHSIVDQALPDSAAYDRAGAEVNKDVILAKLLRKTARRLKHGGNDLTSFRNQNDMSKQDFQRQLRVVLQMTTTKRELELLFDFLDHDKSGTLDAGEIMKSFFGDSKHIDEYVASVVKKYPEQMKWQPSGRRRAKRAQGSVVKKDQTNQGGKGPRQFRQPGGISPKKQGIGNHILSNFMRKIDDVLLYRRPDLTAFKKQALTKEYFSVQIEHTLGVKHTQEELDLLFDYFDKDGDGTLDYVEIFLKFFSKSKTGQRPTAPPPTVYAGQKFKFTRPSEDVNSDDDNEVDQKTQDLISKNLPVLLQGDNETAAVLRRLSQAFDTGGADPLAGLDLRGFRGRNLTKIQFRKQCKLALGVKLTKAEVGLVFECFDEDGGGTMEYNEFLLGLKGPLYSALSRLKAVIEEDRIHRDMRSFQGRELDKEEFAYQCAAVLNVKLLPSELDAVFEFFDKDGGGTISYDEILLKFTKREDMDVNTAGKHKRKQFKPGFSNHRVNLDRIKRRREREIKRKQMAEDRKKLRSARIRKNLRQAFEDRLANRINLGLREKRTSIADRQKQLVAMHASQSPGAPRHDTQHMLDKTKRDFEAVLANRPITPPTEIQPLEESKTLFSSWMITLKKVFKL